MQALAFHAGALRCIRDVSVELAEERDEVVPGGAVPGLVHDLAVRQPDEELARKLARLRVAEVGRKVLGRDPRPARNRPTSSWKGLTGSAVARAPTRSYRCSIARATTSETSSGSKGFCR